MIPKVSIVIPVYNGQNTLMHCLDSLMQLDYSREDFEIVVVDNNSSDNSKEIALCYPVKYVFEGNRGRAIARNRGIVESDGDLIAYIDSDCTADRQWLKFLVAGIEDRTIGGCGGEIHAVDNLSLLHGYYKTRLNVSQKKELTQNNFLLPCMNTRNAIYRRDALLKVGLFDERLVTNEDIDLCWRMFLNGYKLHYLPEAEVYYQNPRSVIHFFMMWHERGFAARYLMCKYSNIIRVPLFSYCSTKSLITNYFLYCKRFIKALIHKENAINKAVPFFDSIRETAYYFGNLYAGIIIHLGINKIEPLRLTDNRLIWGTINDETLITKTQNDFCYIITGTGKEVWNLLMQGKDMSEITDIISEDFAIDRETVRQDIMALAEELKREDLLSQEAN